MVAAPRSRHLAAFYLALAALVLVELVRAYLVMPLPGSQLLAAPSALGRVQLAHALYGARWWLRLALVATAAVGAAEVLRRPRRWPAGLAVLAAGLATWAIDAFLSAERQFAPPRQLVLAAPADSRVDRQALVLGVAQGGEARAYPIRYLVYHHQVEDTVGGTPVLVTYCSVCRTGRAYSPVVDGQRERFRLVGMDHFNALFEDGTTGSWWRQATGEAIVGPRRGQRLAEVPSSQMALGEWLSLHPGSRILQPDPAAMESYDPDAGFERGAGRSDLTRTDPASWHDKSWVLGVEAGGASKAFDWKELEARRLIVDTVGGVRLAVVLAADARSFGAFALPEGAPAPRLDGDRLVVGERRYDLAGRSDDGSGAALAPIPARQEFWHSWRVFHPATLGGP